MGRHGQGSIRETPTGFQALYTRKYVQYSAGVHPTRALAVKALREALTAVDKGANAAVQRKENPRVRDVLADWQKANRQGWTANGKRIYAADARHIVAHLGDVQLRELRRADVECLRDELLEGTAWVGQRAGANASAVTSGGRTAGTASRTASGSSSTRGRARGVAASTTPMPRLSPKSVRNIVGTLSTAIRWHLGLESPVILRNPCEGVKVAVPRFQWKWLTPEQARKLTDTLVSCEDERQPYANFFGMALETLRRCESELCALRVSDVDLANRRYRIEQVMEHGNKRAIVPAGDPVSGRKHKRRSYDLSEGAAWYADRQMRWLRDHAAPVQLDGALRPDLLLFTEAHLEPFAESTMRREFRRFLERAGLPRIRIHDLRHTGASLLLAQGESIAVVQEIGGWANKAVLLEVYSHVMPGTARQAMDKYSRGLREAK